MPQRRRDPQVPDDDVPDEILGTVRQSEDIGIIDQEDDNYVPNADDDDRETGQCL